MNIDSVPQQKYLVIGDMTPQTGMLPISPIRGHTTSVYVHVLLWNGNLTGITPNMAVNSPVLGGHVNYDSVQKLGLIFAEIFEFEMYSEVLATPTIS